MLRYGEKPLGQSLSSFVRMCVCVCKCAPVEERQLLHEVKKEYLRKRYKLCQTTQTKQIDSEMLQIECAKDHDTHPTLSTFKSIRKGTQQFEPRATLAHDAHPAHPAQPAFELKYTQRTYSRKTYASGCALPVG